MTLLENRPKQRVFITGATGVVGVHVVPVLAVGGYDVTAVARSTEKRRWLESVGARAVSLDLLDAEGARRVLQGHDTVINLATHMPSSSFAMLLPWMWRENDRIRREGSAVLTEAARAVGVTRFIQESFAPVYEDGGDSWIDERWPQRPAPYNRTVFDAEHAAIQFGNRGGIGVVLRFAGFYGPDAFLRDMAKMVKRGWAPLPGRTDAYWSSVAHEDAASAVVAALNVPAGVYNVSDEMPLTRREWADALADAIGARPPRLMPQWLTALGGSTMELLSRSQRMTSAKLRSASGWAPRWRSAREGLIECGRLMGLRPADRAPRS